MPSGCSMNEAKENTSREAENNDRSNTRVAGTRFGQNLWLEVERWRRHQTNARNPPTEEAKNRSENSGSASVEDDPDCSPSSSKKARYAWQVKKSSVDTAEVESSSSRQESSGDQVKCRGVDVKSADSFNNKKLLPREQNSHDHTCDFQTCKTETVSENRTPCSSHNDTNTATSSSRCCSRQRNNVPTKEQICTVDKDKQNKHYKLDDTPNKNVEASMPCNSVPDNVTTMKNESLKRKFDKVSGESPRSTSNRSRPVQPTFLERWQKKHIAKAVVDNAVNKTLSELGLSPDSDFNQFASQSRNVELEGVSAVIQSRGLRQQSLEPFRASDIFQRLAPAVDQFNDATERLSFNGMFHMVGCLDFNPLPRPSNLANTEQDKSRSDVNESIPLEKSSVNLLYEEEHPSDTNSCNCGNAKNVHKDAVASNDQRNTSKEENSLIESETAIDLCSNTNKEEEAHHVNVIDEALCVAISERGLMFNSSIQNQSDGGNDTL